MDLYQKSQIRKIKNEHDFRFTKSLGQNFLVDLGVIETIIDSSGIGENDLVIEIGPGMGTLTGLAAERSRKLIAVEIDKDLIPILSETLCEYGNIATVDSEEKNLKAAVSGADITILNADILKTDLASVIGDAKAADPDIENVQMIGNLPYYITTPIIMKLLREDIPAAGITIMMQKEVADRIKAAPGSKTYGALSVAVQYYCEVMKVCEAGAECFEPRPKVDSEVLRLDIREERAVKVMDEDLFFECVKAGFSQRRKTLANCLKNLADISKEDITAALADAGIEPSRRAETLSIEEFGALADSIYSRRY